MQTTESRDYLHPGNLAWKARRSRTNFIFNRLNVLRFVNYLYTILLCFSSKQCNCDFVCNIFFIFFHKLI